MTFSRFQETPEETNKIICDELLWADALIASGGLVEVDRGGVVYCVPQHELKIGERIVRSFGLVKQALRALIK